MSEIKVTGTNTLNIEEPSEEVIISNVSVNPDDQAGDAKEFKVGDGYDKIEIPDSAVFGKEEPVDPDEEPVEVTTESTEEATAEPESEDEPVAEEENAVLGHMIDGTEYTQEDVEQWRTDSSNKGEWQKSNTEKAQEIADAKRSFEPFTKLMDKFRGSEEFADTVREAVIDEFGDEAGQLFDQSLKNETDLPETSETQESQDTPEVTELKEKNLQLESQARLNDQLSDLMDKHELTSEEVDNVLTYAVEHKEKTGILLTPEDAFKVMVFDEVEKQPTKPKPSVPVNIKKGVGVKSDSKKKTFTSYEDIDINSFFNN